MHHQSIIYVNVPIAYFIYNKYDFCYCNLKGKKTCIAVVIFYYSVLLG